MKLIKALVFASFLISLGVKAQTQIRNREFSFANENDVYLLIDIDRYYSNGMFFNYRFLPKSFSEDSARSKVVFDLGLAQKIWTPQDVNIINPNAYYRPYAGYSYLSFRMNHFKTNLSRFSYGMEVGVIGKASGAQQFQEWYHGVFGFSIPKGWENQIANGLIVDLDLEYNRQLRIVPRKFDVITSSSLSLGTGFSNLRQRVDVRFGKLNSLNQSAFFNSLVGSSEVTKHYYLFLGYGIESVFHNASIQGHLFGVEDPNKREAMPWVRHLRLGWAKSTASYTLKATYNWLSQEVRGRAGRHAFIGFELNVRVPAKTS